MKKITRIVLLTLSPLAAHAACNVVPLSTDQLNVTRISGEIIAGGSSCSYSGNVVDFYSFEAKAGDVLEHSGSYSSDLSLIDPNGTTISWPAKMILPSTGVYKIAINASTNSRMGSYYLELRSSAPTQTTPVNPSARTCKVVALTTEQLNGTRIAGELIAGGPPCQALIGSNVDYYSFQANTGDILEKTAGNYSSDLSLIDPNGTAISWPAKMILPSTGAYKIAINASTNSRMGSYYLEIKKSSPAQPVPIATCPSDTYNNGKLTINSVEVPNGVGGMLKYKAIMTLQALSNPLVFTVDQTTPLQ